MRQPYIQDRFMCSSCAIVSSIHSAEHACRNSTSVCSTCIHDFPYNKLNKKSRFCKPRLLFESGLRVGMQLQRCGFYSRAASIRERLLFESGFYSRAASIRERLLFESGFYSRAASIRERLLFESGFYSRAASIQGRLLYKTLWYAQVVLPYDGEYGHGSSLLLNSIGDRALVLVQ